MEFERNLILENNFEIFSDSFMNLKLPPIQRSSICVTQSVGIPPSGVRTTPAYLSWFSGDYLFGLDVRSDNTVFNYISIFLVSII